MSDGTRRSYVSPLRDEAARATRLRVVDAARELMLERGYAQTTVAAIAARAGVAVQTVYSSCPGGKAGLAKAVWDVTLVGDGQPIPQSDRPEVQRILDEPDPAQKLVLFAAMATTIPARLAPVHRVLREAAGDKGARSLLEATENERLAGSRPPAEHLASIGALRPGLTAERAAECIYALTSIELYERLVEGCGWSPAEFQRWLAELLVDTLLEPSAVRPKEVGNPPDASP